MDKGGFYSESNGDFFYCPKNVQKTILEPIHPVHDFDKMRAVIFCYFLIFLYFFTTKKR